MSHPMQSLMIAQMLHCAYTVSDNNSSLPPIPYMLNINTSSESSRILRMKLVCEGIYTFMNQHMTIHFL